MFPKGDISGKYNSLMGPSQQLNLPELPIYGPFTLMGRTMREISTDVCCFCTYHLEVAVCGCNQFYRSRV